MRRYGACVTLFVIGLVLLLNPTARTRAEDPQSSGDPGGNEGLTWTEDSTVTKIENQQIACGKANSNCIDAVMCYRQDVTYGMNLYKGWAKSNFSSYNQCTKTDVKGAYCNYIGSVKCADVLLYPSVLLLPDGSYLCWDEPTQLVGLYVKGGCNFGPQ